jgi:4-amino-4-deoxy-L-arabinose transferase-like glycosyltransferase
MRSNLVPVFVLTLLLTLIVQGFIWHVTSFTDERVWLRRTSQLMSDLQGGQSGWQQASYSGHPGMAALLVAALIHATTGAETLTSLRTAVTVLNGLTIAGVFTAAKALRAHQYAWLAAGALVLFNPLYVQASPTNAVMAPLIVLIMLLLLKLYQLRDQKHTHISLLFGVCVGLGLATRLPVTFMIGAMLLPWLWWTHGLRQTATIYGVAVAIGFAFNPLLWHIPTEHLVHVFERVDTHLNQVPVGALSWRDFILFAPLALLGIILATLSLVWTRLSPSALPRSPLLVILVITLVSSFVFLRATTQSLRYFFPVIFTWEALLPLFLLEASSHVQFSFIHQPRQRHTAKLLTDTFVITLLVAGQLFLLLFALDINRRLLNL